MSRDIAPFGLRMPAELKARIEEWAVKNSRSINSEIIGRLVASLEANQRPLMSYTDGDLIKELVDRYDRGAISIQIIGSNVSSPGQAVDGS